MPVLKMLFIIDPPQRLDPPTDTTLAIMQEAQSRGHRVYFAELGGLFVDRGQPVARGWGASFAGPDQLAAGEVVRLDLGDVDAVFMRKDPPVDLTYLHATEILDLLPPRVLQVNAPGAIRQHGEKIIPLHFPDLMPETLVSADAELLASLFDTHERIVVKVLEECSGRGVQVIDKGDTRREETLRRATAGGTRFVQGQEFLPQIERGDIRVLMLDGEMLGHVRRVPPEGSFRSNVNAGGHCVPCDLGEEERAVCRRIGPWLKRNGIYLAGIDIVAGKVLEVNITSPSCLREINTLYGTCLERDIVDFVEKKLGAD
ncbi:MAG: glutathione synthase [Desulfuromonadales bacterium]|nr:glutathione synthase [Desulfuromonadales bacterium]NIR33746.1 glutathione synthase [Desulfuromonadales bacterium]NIS43742.1 glutathione synthase [Desulfuromonadales bacterium]